jgi:hypothetical protein
LLVAGYVMAIVLPVVGVVLGVLILVRRRTWHGIAIILLSFAVVVAILALPRGDGGGDLPPEAERRVRRTQHCLERHLIQKSAKELLRIC